MTITIETAGRRSYIAGDTYPHRAEIKAAGAHWDGDRKAWWIGSRATAEALAERLNGASAAPADAAKHDDAPGLRAVVAGRASYKGRGYYVAGRTVHGRTRYDDRVQAITSRDGSRVLLYSSDGSMQFWAARDAAEIIKTYGRPQTIQGLRNFASQAREAGSAELAAAYRYGWDGKVGSPSYYSSGAFDELDQ
jgi:hypothetical protein